MNRVIGILAHVDAGKTTLSEQLLRHAGVLRVAGRVDHGDAFLDAHPLERQRGITIFSDQAVFERDGERFFWVDTPGHADFAAEMERAVSVMDCAVLVINGAEGIQSHTETIWALLKAWRVPTVLFVNKTDRPGFDAEATLGALKKRLSGDIVDMGSWRGGDLPPALVEAVAERDEALLDRLMDDDYDPAAWLDGLRGEVSRRLIFPVFRGSALNDVGVDAFLDALIALNAGGAAEPSPGPFAGWVYKVRHDAQGARVCFIRVLRGTLMPRQELRVPGGTEKVNELRLYSGPRFRPLPRAEAGMLVAVTGLTGARVGDIVGDGEGLHLPEAMTHRRGAFLAEPMLAASVICGEGVAPGRALEALRQLEEEDPALAVAHNPGTGAIDVRVMGKIQLEVLRQLMLDRFGMAIDFGSVRVLYMETIAAPAVGVGHYEPLRHYAEVQLRLVPGPRGSGIRFESLCHVDELALNWQRLIETHVYEKVHKGVLTGAPLTDVVVQLLHGRAHLKHTEGGDFRQSTYRAIRNALMRAGCVLLEPVCRFRLSAPQDSYGRVMGDLNRMRARLEPPEPEGERFALAGEARFAELSAYSDDFLAATRGRGSLSYQLDHYEPCRDAEGVAEAAGYNPLADDTPDSVFCAHGAGYTVPWDQVFEHAHCPVEPNVP